MSANCKNAGRLRLGLLSSAVAVCLACVCPLAPGAASLWSRSPLWQVAMIASLILLLGAWRLGLVATTSGLTAAVLTAGVTVVLLHDPAIAGSASTGFWLLVVAGWLAAACSVMNLAATRRLGATWRKAQALAIPLLFGATLLYLWEVAVRGFGVPPVLLPPPSAAGAKFASSLPILAADFVQTFIKGVLVGYAIGCGTGLLVAVLAHHYAFLERGLLPLANFFSALPLVGIAPIMVMWFGFDWPSKAAVVALITFFPMLVNTLAGLSEHGHIERDLMRSYAAGHQQSLHKLYLPAALPLIFNALKINATLALIGAIVAEFFGTPTLGIGFRISSEAGRMATDMVWAEIALASLAGMAFYGLVALAERATTFWHPSYRT
jgi:NitT/TauT family transport system permease protein